MLLWEVAEQGIKCYAEKRGKQLRVQEAAARAREDQRVLKEASKNTLRKGSTGKERRKEITAAKATPQEVQSFSDEELKLKRNGEEQFRVRVGDHGIYTVDRAQIFLGRWQRDDKDEVAGHAVVMNDDVHGYVPTDDGSLPCDGSKIWYWQKKEGKLLEPQEVTGTAGPESSSSMNMKLQQDQLK